MSRFSTGLVVGKFAPLHLGHEQVIRTAMAACDHVVLLSYSRPEFSGCEPHRRAAWLVQRFPETTRIVLNNSDEPIPENSAPDDDHRAFCASILRRRIDRPIDAIFTSESYGQGFAADLSYRQGAPVAHVSVDLERRTLPISGTALRADVHGLHRFLSAEVYADFIQRITILGGESTGKSTLVTALARKLSTSQVAEYGRELWDLQAGDLSFNDLLAIAREQIRREEAALLLDSTHQYLICDTSPLTTLFYSLEMFGRAEPELQALAQRPYDQYLLCADDFPFLQDGTRHDTEFRSKAQEWYRRQLQHKPYILVHGSLLNRLSQATKILTQTMEV